jgi:hypothetical protein
MQVQLEPRVHLDLKASQEPTDLPEQQALMEQQVYLDP